jgi:RNA polymerase sigma-70 factor (ECF subfamily)
MKAVMTASAQEREQVEAAKRDPAHFEALYENNFYRVYAYLARRTGRRDLAEDLTQEVFRDALLNLNKFEWRGTPFAAWLLRIASNAVVDFYNKSHRDANVPVPEEPTEEQIERTAMLFQLVERLPAAQQRVIEARFVEDKSIGEIAEELDRSEGAVKQLQLRALENLREAMEAGR